MVTTAVTITGIDELRKKISGYSKKTEKVVDKAMNDTADAILLEAMRLVPVATSTLRNSIGTNLEYLHKIIYADADYAKDIEFGEPIGGNKKTQNHPKRATPTGPRPFMRPAFQTQSPRLKEFYEKRSKEN